MAEYDHSPSSEALDLRSLLAKPIELPLGRKDADGAVRAALSGAIALDLNNDRTIDGEELKRAVDLAKFENLKSLGCQVKNAPAIVRDVANRAVEASGTSVLQALQDPSGEKIREGLGQSGAFSPAPGSERQLDSFRQKQTADHLSAAASNPALKPLRDLAPTQVKGVALEKLCEDVGAELFTMPLPKFDPLPVEPDQPQRPAPTPEIKPNDGVLDRRTGARNASL